MRNMSFYRNSNIFRKIQEYISPIRQEKDTIKKYIKKETWLKILIDKRKKKKTFLNMKLRKFYRK